MEMARFVETRRKWFDAMEAEQQARTEYIQATDDFIAEMQNQVDAGLLNQRQFNAMQELLASFLDDEDEDEEPEGEAAGDGQGHTQNWNQNELGAVTNPHSGAQDGYHHEDGMNPAQDEGHDHDYEPEAIEQSQSDPFQAEHDAQAEHSQEATEPATTMAEAAAGRLRGAGGRRNPFPRR